MRKTIHVSLIFLVSLSSHLFAQKGKDSYSESSVLSSGEWFRIAVTADGVYKIDYSKLRQLGLSDPSNPKIFGNNWGQLSYYNDDPKPDDLRELPVFISGSDNTLNEGEYLLFYAKGTGKWIFNAASGDYDFIKHNYSDTAYYFLTSGSSPGKRITVASEPLQQENYYSPVSDALFIHEIDNENLISSGREWFQPISSSNGIPIKPGFSDILVTEKMKCSFRVASRSSAMTMFRLYEGETIKKSIQMPGLNLYDYIGTYAIIASDTALTTPASSTPVYEMRFYNNGETGAKGWIDWVKLQGRRSNIFSGAAMQYSDSKSVAPGRITKFSINTTIHDFILWDISDQFNTRQIQYTQNAGNITFKSSTDSLKTFFAFTPGNTGVPLIKPSRVPNQDLHATGAADMIIVTHPMFRKYAEKLAAIHFKNNGLISQIVTPEQIYNEFSGGIPDIAAIRNFMRMKYQIQKGTSQPLKYLLLFGDGSFENKTPPPHNTNFIPTYQSQNSSVWVSSFTSDDFYTLLEDGAGEADGVECIGAGRFPVSDTVQAGILVNKVARYISPSNIGDWKNIICLTADDEDGNTHMIDAEGLSTALNTNSPDYTLDKIYLDAFKQTTSVNGQSYPEVNKAIDNRINAGCLIFNFTGHGSENGLAAERVVKPENINSWTNGSKLPLFVTATCEFSRFDNIETNVTTGEMTGKTSAGEMAILNPYGGAIALMSTTRIVYSAPNFLLNRNILYAAFLRDASGNSMCLGDIIRIAKNLTASGTNKRNFTLLGDPAVKLGYPWHGAVMTDSVNSSTVLGKIDTLKALSNVTISGHIEDQSGKIMTSFNGVLEPLVFDKSSKVKTLANDGGPVMDFELRNNVLFRGKTNVSNGRFSFSFIVPRDIDYTFGYGKISYYANNDSEDMNGNFADAVVGGFNNIVQNDTSGPVIKLYMNDTLFKNGGITDENPKLLAIIEDTGGINTTGTGIGHDLIAYIDSDRNSSFVLNSYFENDFDNYTRGEITYALTGLTGGSHSITLKAWDNFNNSTEKSILFVVETGGKFVLSHLINYPNPFLNSTSITAEHNRPDTELEIRINIYSQDGRAIKIIKTNIISEGYSLPPIVWDGNDDGGKRVARGLYPYTLTITCSDGITETVSGRMIIL